MIFSGILHFIFSVIFQYKTECCPQTASVSMGDIAKLTKPKSVNEAKLSSSAGLS